MKRVNIKQDIPLRNLNIFAEELKKLFKKPQVLLLCGPLGAGKTTLARLLLKKEGTNNLEESLSGGEQVVSPAFAVHHSYLTAFGVIEHIDLYRLKNDEDLESTGFWDIFSEPEKKYLIIIEWGNRLNLKCLPPRWNYIKVTFSFGTQKDTRGIKMELL